MRWAARKDENQADIVRALQQMGVLVEVLNMPNITDLLCIRNGYVCMMEVKNPAAAKGKRKLRPGQEKFRIRWVAAGGNHARVETIDEALNAMGLRVK
jgi:hypothetical protein